MQTTNSSNLLRETKRQTVSQRDNVGFRFDVLPPESVSVGFRYRTHAGGGIAGIETRSCSSLRQLKTTPKNGHGYALHLYCVSVKTTAALLA